MSRQHWRERVLPDWVKQSWDHPHALAQLITRGLQDGFAADLIEPARRLRDLETTERSGVLLSIVLRENGDLEGAERELASCMERHGLSAIALVNLARVHADRSDHARLKETLWQALQQDPNFPDAVTGYVAVSKQAQRPESAAEALLAIAGLPGSWRAHLSLARGSLHAGQPKKAIEHYRQALSNAPLRPPAELLHWLIGDLAAAGQARAALDLALPRFEPKHHGLQGVGDQLLELTLAERRFSDARQLLDGLKQVDQPTWTEPLAEWSARLAAAEAAV